MKVRVTMAYTEFYVKEFDVPEDTPVRAMAIDDWYADEDGTWEQISDEARLISIHDIVEK